MAASQATIGHGTLVQIKIASVYTTIPEVESVTPDSTGSTAVEVTNFDSPDATQEYIAGINQAGQITVGGNYIGGNSVHQELEAAAGARVLREFRITFPGSARTLSFWAVITSMGVNLTTAGKLVFSLVLQRSGKITYA